LDVRGKLKELPLAVVMLPPVKGTSKTYDQARHVFEKLQATPVSEAELPGWAREVAAGMTS